MKKIILILLISFGLQTQAQTTLCESMTATGSQYQVTMEIININTFIDYWLTTAPDMTMLAEDVMSNTHIVYSVNPMSLVPYDTITTLIASHPSTCCVTWVWNGTFWVKMGITTGIKEVEIKSVDNRIYDLLGRELIKIPKNKMYIKNNKIYLND